jgi:subtilase family serine protease
MATPRSLALSRRAYALLTAAVLVLAVGVAPSASAAVGAKPVLNLDFGCVGAAKGKMHCLGKMRAHRNAKGWILPNVTPGPVGLGPSDLKSAYNLSGTSGNGRTVAIVDAMDDPKAESDLAVYRQAYGLPACTTANGCFKKVNQTGAASPLPAGDYGWAEEISLDLDMVSAICPDCHILLVEATSATGADLTTAIDTAAATSGVVAVSNSWGGGEDSSTLALDSHLNHPGVAITASSGDGGYGVSWPASSRLVTAVGGTTLKKASNTRGWTETAWSGSGSGCSANEAKGSWQTDSGCARRTVADVSAVADPATGVGVYDTYNFCGTALGDNALCDWLVSIGVSPGLSGWATVGGTSASSPIIASVYALAGNTSGISNGSYPYGHASALFDVTSGSNGSCGGSYLCTAGTGYDGPTGLGTPNGTGAF